MKKALHIIALAVFGIALHVEAIASELTLKSADRRFFTARIDNGPLTMPSNRIEFKHLPAGHHRIVVFRHQLHCPAGAQVIFDNMVFVPANVFMKTVLKPNGNLIVAEVIPAAGCVNPYMPYNNYPNYGYGYNNYGNNGGYMPGMFSPADFDALRNTISKQSFDDTRLTIARQAISNRSLSTSQVRQLMDMFTFESTKLDFAKYAYQYVYDRNNYFMVNDGFTFSSTIDELNQFIGSNG